MIRARLQSLVGRLLALVLLVQPQVVVAGCGGFASRDQDCCCHETEAVEAETGATGPSSASGREEGSCCSAHGTSDRVSSKPIAVEPRAKRIQTSTPAHSLAGSRGQNRSDLEMGAAEPGDCGCRHEDRGPPSESSSRLSESAPIDGRYRTASSLVLGWAGSAENRIVGKRPRPSTGPPLQIRLQVFLI